MNYEDPRLQDALASEYALGTLHGRARRRLETLAAENARLHGRIVAWQERLMPLNDELMPVVPPATVWHAIEQKLGLMAARPRSGAPGSPRLWRALAAGFALLSLVLGLLLLDEPPEPVTPEYMSIMTDAEGTPLWLLQMDEDTRIMRARVLATLQPGAGRSYEAWMLPADGSAPISMGVLPESGTGESLLAAEKFAALARASGLAVSLEPEGGSPTGQPTGPVLYSAPLVPG
ncbi:MAG: anti-sigma factor [Gammaproteobacteria bacterium]|nr:anti-sigma factor [Gammaproteobacteria bacterium]